MKVKVVRAFRDKNKKNLHKKGQIINISKERFEEINSTALGIFVEEFKGKEGD